MASDKLGEFLQRTCEERGLSLRSLSINAGLSPGTVHNILKRQYQPTIFSLNRLADYLGVKRQYLWQLAGLLQDMDYDPEIPFNDPRLKFYFAQADKLPEEPRNLLVELIKSITNYFQSGDKTTESASDE